MKIIEKAQQGDVFSKIFDSFLVILIILNVVSVFLETFTIPFFLKKILSVFEVFSITVFTIEYVLRVWTATFIYPNVNPFMARIKYIFSLNFTI